MEQGLIIQVNNEKSKLGFEEILNLDIFLVLEKVIIPWKIPSFLGWTQFFASKVGDSVLDLKNTQPLS